MFKMSTSGHNSCPQPKSLLISCLINDRLTVSCVLPQLINMSQKLVAGFTRCFRKNWTLGYLIMMMIDL